MLPTAKAQNRKKIQRKLQMTGSDSTAEVEGRVGDFRKIHQRVSTMVTQMAGDPLHKGAVSEEVCWQLP